MTEPRGGSGSFNVYLDPAKGEWLDSCEGVPTPAAPEALPGERRLTFGWQKSLHRALHGLGQLAPGLGLAVCLAVACTRCLWFSVASLLSSHQFCGWAIASASRPPCSWAA
jgi:hypothetical protein